MALEVRKLLTAGVERTTAPNGLMFIAMLVPLDMINVILMSSLMASRDMFMDAPAVNHLVVQKIAFGIPSEVLVVLQFVLVMLMLAIIVAALRTFNTDRTEQVAVEHFTDDITLTVLNFFIGLVIVSIAAMAGMIIFIIPGLIVLLSCWLFSMYVAVDDREFYIALYRSWVLAQGHRIQLLLIAMAIIAVWILVELLFTPVYVILGNGLGETGIRTSLIGAFPFAIMITFVSATTAQIYRELIALEETTEDDVSEGPEEEEPEDEKPADGEQEDMEHEETTESDEEEETGTDEDTDKEEQDTQDSSDSEDRDNQDTAEGNVEDAADTEDADSDEPGDGAGNDPDEDRDETAGREN